MDQELADRAAIVDAAIAYAMALDSRDWERLGSLFTDDACWEYSGSGERLAVHPPQDHQRLERGKPGRDHVLTCGKRMSSSRKASSGPTG